MAPLIKLAATVLATALLLATPVHSDGSATVRIFSDKNCHNELDSVNLDVGGSGGCVTLQAPQTFDSAVLDRESGYDRITACQRGFACDQVGANQLDLLEDGLGGCITGNNGVDFDKFIVCLP